MSRSYMKRDQFFLTPNAILRKSLGFRFKPPQLPSHISHHLAQFRNQNVVLAPVCVDAALTSEL
eukprot:3516299-Rhodomonas_salina.1